MAQGIRLQQFTCPNATYPSNDVRGRINVLQQFRDWLVGLNIGWSVHKEEIPTSDFTTQYSAYYKLWLKYKTSDHLILLSTFAGPGVTAKVQPVVFAKNLSETVVLNSVEGVVISDTTVGHILNISLYFGGDDWSAISFQPVGDNVLLPWVNSQQYKTWVTGMSLTDFVTGAAIDITGVGSGIEAAFNAMRMPGSDTDYMSVGSYPLSFTVPTGSSKDVLTPLYFSTRYGYLASGYGYSNDKQFPIGVVVTVDNKPYIIGPGTHVLYPLSDT